ncbi:30S ribosomal protein S18 [Thermostilla marina]
MAKRKKRVRAKRRKRDPLMVGGEYPRPLYVDYKDIDLLKKLTNRQGKIIGRRKSGCSAMSQHAVTKAIKRARFMALLPYVGD